MTEVSPTTMMDSPTRSHASQSSSVRTPSRRNEEVVYEVNCKVMGMAGITVDRTKCRDSTRKASSPSVPEHMSAVVTFLHEGQMHAVTAPSKLLKRSPADEVVMIGSGEDTSLAPEIERHLALWDTTSHPEGSLVYLETRFKRPVGAKAAVAAAYARMARRSFTLLIGLTDSNEGTFARLVGTAELVVSAEQARLGKLTLDIPVAKVAQNQFVGDAFPVVPLQRCNNEQLRAKKKRGIARMFSKKEPDEQERLEADGSFTLAKPSSFPLAYAVDSQGDAVIRVEVEVNEKEFNYEVDVDETGMEQLLLPPTPIRESLEGKLDIIAPPTPSSYEEMEPPAKLVPKSPANVADFSRNISGKTSDSTEATEATTVTTKSLKSSSQAPVVVQSVQQTVTTSDSVHSDTRRDCYDIATKSSQPVAAKNAQPVPANSPSASATKSASAAADSSRLVITAIAEPLEKRAVDIAQSPTRLLSNKSYSSKVYKATTPIKLTPSSPLKSLKSGDPKVQSPAQKRDANLASAKTPKSSGSRNAASFHVRSINAVLHGRSSLSIAEQGIERTLTAETTDSSSITKAGDRGRSLSKKSPARRAASVSTIERAAKLQNPKLTPKRAPESKDKQRTTPRPNTKKTKSIADRTAEAGFIKPTASPPKKALPPKVSAKPIQKIADADDLLEKTLEEVVSQAEGVLCPSICTPNNAVDDRSCQNSTSGNTQATFESGVEMTASAYAATKVNGVVKPGAQAKQTRSLQPQNQRNGMPNTPTRNKTMKLAKQHIAKPVAPSHKASVATASNASSMEVSSSFKHVPVKEKKPTMFQKILKKSTSTKKSGNSSPDIATPQENSTSTVQKRTALSGEDGKVSVDGQANTNSPPVSSSSPFKATEVVIDSDLNSTLSKTTCTPSRDPDADLDISVDGGLDFQEIAVDTEHDDFVDAEHDARMLSMMEDPLPRPNSNVETVTSRTIGSTTITGNSAPTAPRPNIMSVIGCGGQQSTDEDVLESTWARFDDMDDEESETTWTTKDTSDSFMDGFCTAPKTRSGLFNVGFCNNNSVEESNARRKKIWKDRMISIRDGSLVDEADELADEMARERSQETIETDLRTEETDEGATTSLEDGSAEDPINRNVVALQNPYAPTRVSAAPQNSPLKAHENAAEGNDSIKSGSVFVTPTRVETTEAPLDEVSPRGVDDELVSHGGHTKSSPERNSFKTHLLDVFSCRTGIDEADLADNGVPSVLAVDNADDDNNSLGDLTATTHEKQVDSAAHQERVNSARASLFGRTQTAQSDSLGGLFACGYGGCTSNGKNNKNKNHDDLSTIDSLVVDPEQEDLYASRKKAPSFSVDDNESLDRTLPRGSHNYNHHDFQPEEPLREIRRVEV